MFALLRRAPATTAGRRGRVALRLERMEGRAAPSGELAPPSTPPLSGDVAGPVNQAPQITGLSVQAISGGYYVVSGRVIDESPGGLVVKFGGSVSSLIGATVTTQPDGTFSLTVRLRTDGSDTGWLLATTRDNQGLASNQASCYVDPVGP